MNKNIKIFIAIFIGLNIFFVLLKGLDNEKTYISSKNLGKSNLEITSKGLFSDQEFSIKELIKKDNFSIINIWASWCEPCKKEHQYLMRLSEKNLNIIGLNYRDSQNNAKIFLKKMGNPYAEILIDPDGTKSIELGAIGVPETYLINSVTNKILKKFIGPLDQEKVDEIFKIINNE